MPIRPIPSVRTTERFAPLHRLTLSDRLLAPTGDTYHALSARRRDELSAPTPALDVPEKGLQLGQVTLRRDGRLWFGDDELAGIVALANQGLVRPFADLRSPADRAAVAERLAHVHRALCLETNAADGTQARAAALSLLLSLAIETRDPSLFEQRLDAEPDVAVRSFTNARAIAAYRRGDAPALRARAETYDVSRPPYEKWGDVVRIVFYVDNDGTTRSRIAEHLRVLGLEPSDGPGGWTTYRGDGLEIELAPPPVGKPRVFARVGEPDVDVIVYSGHAGYGQNIRDAVGQGVHATGEGKLIVSYQCTGTVNSNDIRTFLPAAQFVSTTEGTRDAIDLRMFDTMISGFRRRRDWRAIQSEVAAAIADLEPTHDLSKHYFYPDQSEVQEGYTDRDDDGVADARDAMFNVVTPGAEQSHLRSGRSVRHVTENLALVLRYAQLLPTWSASAVVAEGYYDAPEDDAAFRFAYDATTKTLSLAMNARFAELDERTLGEYAAIELGRFLGALGRVDADALSLALVERMRHQTDARYAPLHDEAALGQQRAVFERYGIVPSQAERAIAAVGAPEDFAPEHLERIASVLREPRSVTAEEGAREATLHYALVASGFAPRRAAELVDRYSSARATGSESQASVTALLAALDTDSEGEAAMRFLARPNEWPTLWPRGMTENQLGATALVLSGLFGRALTFREARAALHARSGVDATLAVLRVLPEPTRRAFSEQRKLDVILAVSREDASRRHEAAALVGLSESHALAAYYRYYGGADVRTQKRLIAAAGAIADPQEAFARMRPILVDALGRATAPLGFF